MYKSLKVIEDEILFIGQQLNEEFYEKYNSGGITLQQLEDAYKILSLWSLQSESVLKMLENYN